MFALCNKINRKFKPGLLKMSTVCLKLPFPAANESLPNVKHEEGVRNKEIDLAEQEDVPTMSTLHDKQTKRIKSNQFCISVSIKSRNTKYKHQTGL